MRTASPAGSFKSQQASARSRPRGRDVFDEEMIDEAVQTTPQLLLPPPASDTASMKDVEDSSPRRKRPGYFSAREEDLDPLEMDIDDFITPARKRQKTSVSLHQGPKFAALWEPSRRESWPLSEESKVQEEKKDFEERERVKEELKDLQSPAFKLPPSARKEKFNLMDVEQPSPTRGDENGGSAFKFTTEKRETKDTDDVFKFSMPSTNPKKSVGDGSPSTKFSFPKPSTRPTKTADESSIPKFQLPISVPTLDLSYPEKSKSEEDPKQNGSPSKTSTFMETVLLEKAPEDQMDDIPTMSEKKTETGVKSPEIESQSSLFQFSTGPTQSTFGGMSQESSKLAVNGGFNFGKDGTGFGIKTTVSSAPEAMAKNTTEPVQTQTFNFGLPKKNVEESQSEKPAVEKLAETNPVTFNFGLPKVDVSAPPLFGNIASEPKKDATAIPVFNDSNVAAEPKRDHVGNPSVLGRFGGAFNKSESENSKPTFGGTSSQTPSISLFGSTSAPTNPPTANGNVNGAENAPAAPIFGTGISSGFKFGNTTQLATAPEASKKEVTPPPTVPATAIPQDLGDSMDITDSPPTTRTTSMIGDIPSQFPVFPTSGPTSTPRLSTEAPKFNFGQTNITAEKPTLPSFGFNTTEEKKPTTGFPAPTFGSAVNPPFGPASPAPPSAPVFSNFGTFPKKEKTNEKVVEKSFPFQPIASTSAVPNFGAPAPTNTNSLFGSQTTAPLFGSATSSLFGNTPAFPSNSQPSITSPPAPVTSPPSAPQFSFNFPAPTSNAPQPFGSGNSFFSQNPPINNPFSSNPPAGAASPAAFPGINSAPVSPQNHQLPTFPSVIQNQFGSSQSSGSLFGSSSTPAAASAPPPNFSTFAQNLPAAPIFTLGAADMQRSSSDAGPNSGTPGSRKIAHPGRRRPHRRG
jgi:hypothetical protein